MKFYIGLFAILLVLIQIVLSQATLSQELSDNSNLKRMSSAWGKRMSSAWGKRMSSAWGKRSDNEHDEFYNHLLRLLYQQGHLNKYDHLRFGPEHEYNLEEYSVHRPFLNNDDEPASELPNMS